MMIFTKEPIMLMRYFHHNFPFIAVFLSATSALLTSCAVTPDSIVKQPMTAKPALVQAPVASSGAIFNAAAFKPLFEDRRPRFIGDIVTVNITENTSATKAGGSSGGKDAAVDASISSLFNHPVPKANFTSAAKETYADKAAANASNVFTGSISATVTDVLANGNMVISGEKQVSLDKGTEFVRFSGVINPDSITQGNFVSSTKVADARIEYRTNSKIDRAELASMFARFFLSMVAF
jgi:flagellar L-ring protein precursor FlgH